MIGRPPLKRKKGGISEIRHNEGTRNAHVDRYVEGRSCQGGGRPPTSFPRPTQSRSIRGGHASHCAGDPRAPLNWTFFNRKLPQDGARRRIWRIQSTHDLVGDRWVTVTGFWASGSNSLTISADPSRRKGVADCNKVPPDSGEVRAERGDRYGTRE